MRKGRGSGDEVSPQLSISSSYGCHSFFPLFLAGLAICTFTISLELPHLLLFLPSSALSTLPSSSSSLSSSSSSMEGYGRRFGDGRSSADDGRHFSDGRSSSDDARRRFEAGRRLDDGRRRPNNPRHLDLGKDSDGLRNSVDSLRHSDDGRHSDYGNDSDKPRNSDNLWHSDNLRHSNDGTRHSDDRKDSDKPRDSDNLRHSDNLSHSDGGKDSDKPRNSNNLQQHSDNLSHSDNGGRHSDEIRHSDGGKDFDKPSNPDNLRHSDNTRYSNDGKRFDNSMSFDEPRDSNELRHSDDSRHIDNPTHFNNSSDFDKPRHSDNLNHFDNPGDSENSTHVSNPTNFDNPSLLEKPRHFDGQRSFRGALSQDGPLQLRRRYGRLTSLIKTARDRSAAISVSPLQRLVEEASQEGQKAWMELRNQNGSALPTMPPDFKGKASEPCPTSVLQFRRGMINDKSLTLLPCGLMPGSSITVIGKPHPAKPTLSATTTRSSNGSLHVLVSHFVLELQGLNVANGEDPPRIFHVNPRLKGDWSGKPVIEMNTGNRGQWGYAQRCNGLHSWDYEDAGIYISAVLADMQISPWEIFVQVAASGPADIVLILSISSGVDGLPRCEKWDRGDDKKTQMESKVTWWVDKLIGNTPKRASHWLYPFRENATFVLTIQAGWEGFHMSVDGRHIASFQYRMGFILEEAMGLSIKGNIDVISIAATALPSSHPNFSTEKLLEASKKFRAPKPPNGSIELFIGILSASDHFLERMAARRTWLQTPLITSSQVVARFFVALHSSKEVNIQLKEEADYYGDVVILPFIDHYELLVLKTVAICEHGVRNLSAKYIMKCDDDNFVRVDAVLDEVKATHRDKGLYMGNMNLYHKPLRSGKWAVTFEEWPEEAYPPYANGPGYIITSDIAEFVVLQHENQTLWLFKMEDVSMGAWVVHYNSSHDVYYKHNLRFCQFGCIDGYITAHYQSPRQMLCMWDKLSQGKAQCCNLRRRRRL